jgi:hypothetical protein
VQSAGGVKIVVKGTIGNDVMITAEADDVPVARDVVDDILANSIYYSQAAHCGNRKEESEVSGKSR